jgi:hypothetical protein
VTVSSIMSITNPKITDSNWYSSRTDGRVDKFVFFFVLPRKIEKKEEKEEAETVCLFHL